MTVIVTQPYSSIQLIKRKLVIAIENVISLLESGVSISCNPRLLLVNHTAHIVLNDSVCLVEWLAVCRGGGEEGVE